jgi:hypothetical protein
MTLIGILAVALIAGFLFLYFPNSTPSTTVQKTTVEKALNNAQDVKLMIQQKDAQNTAEINQ